MEEAQRERTDIWSIWFLVRPSFEAHVTSWRSACAENDKAVHQRKVCQVVTVSAPRAQNKLAQDVPF